MDRKIKGLFFVFLGVNALYFFFFPVPLGKELLVRPVWNVGFSSAEAHPVPANTQEALGFVLGSTVGYISENGQPVYSEEIMYDAAVTDRSFVNFSRIPELLYVKDSSGRTLLEIPERGYPVLRGDRIFVIDTDRAGVSEWSEGGKLLWRKNFTSLITDIAAGNSLVLIGLLDGTGVLADREGKEVEVIDPAGSRIPVLYGCAISPDEKSIAVISGIDPQRLMVYESRNERFKPVFHTNLESDFRRRVPLSYSSDGRFLFFETPEGLSVLDINTGVTEVLPTAGRPARMIPVFNDSLFVLSSSEPGDPVSAGIRGFLSPDRTFFRLIYPGRIPFLRYRGNSLYLGVDDSIMRIDLVVG